MAYISQRGEYWRAEIRRKGYKPAYRTFDTRLQAQQWARRTEAEMDARTYVDQSEAERTTFRQALERYQKEVIPQKRHPKQEATRVDRWLRHDLAFRTLAALRGADFARYRDERRAAGRAENTIRLELQLVSHLYETARREWGMEGLQNPLRNIRKPSGSKARDRRLRSGEYEQILAGLKRSGNPYAAPAFQLAIETSLRQGTLFALRWEWVDLDIRMLRFPLDVRGASNKSVPAVLPLSTRAVQVLRELRELGDVDGADAKEEETVFRTTSNAVICVWKRVLAGLGIADLRWHDLRHEAVSRLFEKGFHPMEVASISGHKSMQMLKRYTHLNAENLLSRLG
ncbi:tyrosine-type recombinase/integrase [Ralstonia mojiangensis]|uniref:tyrosine-type recombinase/integrase n=1 Tax=Ralstonia mojiangensis TaxID=2953895 RepID=UPI0021B48CEB|nr:site-specific integrase [Ralstonia mojiangensis]MCT7328022.1 site-specific integrase [Ralstonia mojiangensis]